MSLRLRSLPARIAAVAAVAALVLAGGVVATAGTAAAADPAWQTVFRDDFAGSGLPDPNKWILTLGTSYPGGPANFGTGEIETMTDRPENVDVRNGNLYITPQRDSAGQWTSARVETAAANYKPPAGGLMRVESRLQMPNVTGTDAMGYWPAFWMLGGPYRQDRWSWPGIGEFDIMENVQGLNWTYNVLHCGTWGGPCNEPDGINNGVNNAGAPCKVTTCQAGFHTYAIEWDRSGAVDQLRWYLDGELTFTVNADQVPAQTWASLSDHAGYFIILNVAMGGAFPDKAGMGGGPTAATKPGVPMVVDYVDVKYAAGSGAPTTTTTTTATTQPTTTGTTGSTGTTPATTTQPTTTPTSTTQPTSGGTAAPANLRVSGSTSDSLTLTWDGSAGGSYEVLRSGIRIATVTGTSFTDRGLLPNTPYVYSIRGAGVTTPELSTTLGGTSTTLSTPTSAPPATTTTTPPAAGSPSNLRVTGTTGSTISLGWDGPAGASYDVLRSGIRIGTVTGTSFTDLGLFPNTPYLYSIRGNGTTTPEITARIG
ncbi:MAG TPA: family 16 glycosylhydrolase [Nakamurella sp.]